MHGLMISTAFVVLFVSSLLATQATAQQVYIGSTPTDVPNSATGGIDAYGRPINVDGRFADRYGLSVNDYGFPYRNQYRAPNTAYEMSVGNSYGYRLGEPSSYYNGNVPSYTNYPTIVPPRTVIVGGVYPSRTVINNATRGSVIEYTHNGNGYIATPGSSYQTVISSGPSIFPYTTVVQPTQGPVTIESRPTGTVSKSFSGRSGESVTGAVARNSAREITLVYPKNNDAPFSYLLNGTNYSIKPGYSHSFPADRRWTIEFLRNPSTGEIARYDLQAGLYQFLPEGSSWDLKQTPTSAGFEPPPPPSLAPAPTPGL